MEHQDEEIRRRCRRVDGGDVECGCYFDRSSLPRLSPASNEATHKRIGQPAVTCHRDTKLRTSFLSHPPSSHQIFIKCDPFSTSSRRTDICPAIEAPLVTNPQVLLVKKTSFSNGLGIASDYTS
jgi:hypothetical protein